MKSINLLAVSIITIMMGTNALRAKNREEVVSVLLYSSLISISVGIADFFKKRPAELEWKAYNVIPMSRGFGLALNVAF